MERKLLAGILFVVLLGIVSVRNANAADAKKPTIEQQLADIINSQKAIEQRLAALEAKQAAIFNAFANALRPTQGAGSGCGGPGPGAPAMMPPPEDFSKVYKIDLGHSSLQGKKDAKVTIVEFSDFQCPFSQRFHPVVPEVLKAYPNDVNYVLKNFPLQFHQQARPAVKASLAAREQGKYWEMVEALFQSRGNLTEDNFKESAKQLGLNVEKFMKDYKEKDAEWEKIIQEDLSTGANAAVGGTPTFYINGKKTMARDLASFKQEVDKILKGDTKAEAKK